MVAAIMHISRITIKYYTIHGNKYVQTVQNSWTPAGFHCV